MRRDLPSLAQAKHEAKRLRETIAAQGTAITHAQALERVAHGHGFRGWNAIHAELRNRPSPDWTVGCRVTGQYLSQPFAATVLSVCPIRPGWSLLELEFDEAVDVVRFESFWNLRKRLRVRLGPDGFSKERTSDGRPHVALDPRGIGDEIF